MCMHDTHTVDERQAVLDTEKKIQRKKERTKVDLRGS